MTDTLKLATEVWQTSHWTSEQLKRLERFAELVSAPMRADAERYRWLRENCAFETEAWLSHCTPQDYDKAIDAIRAKEQTP